MNEEKNRGIVYYNVGFKCLARLLVSIYSCRKVYSGAVAILCDENSSQLCEKIADKFEAQAGVMDILQLKKNTALLNKTRIAQYTPFDTTIFIDADTVIFQDVSSMFEVAEEHAFVVPQFCNWSTRKLRIRKRLRLWEQYYPELVMPAIRYGKAINTGTFAFRRDSGLMAAWFDMAKVACAAFIPDETCCQLILPQHKHAIVDASYNVSCKYGDFNSRTKVLHFHGRKHCRIAENRYLYHSNIWYKEMDELKESNIFKEVKIYDRHLKRYERVHDSNRRNA